jgi:hypothetical protein
LRNQQTLQYNASNIGVLILLQIKHLKELTLLGLHTNIVIQSNERKLNSFLTAVEGPLGEVKPRLIQQCPDFLCGASSQTGDEPIKPDCQWRYREDKCEEEMDRRVPKPEKGYMESPEKDQRRAQARPDIACCNFEYSDAHQHKIRK